ncbi:MAG: hypothetical protein EOP05_14790 [Proteobacteria bacterium]|nr:MAG: hypothetical protein EOP05_14790 [Pseudomonadota bacterium]
MPNQTPNQTASTFAPLRQLPPEGSYKKGDVLVVFGELFARGYANGIVDEAERAGLKVIYSTVGRRDETGKLRALNEEELKAKAGQTLINIPLEAGFDMEPSAEGITPVQQLAGVKLGEWQNTKLDWAKIEDSRKRGTERFKTQVEAWMKEVEKHIPKGANVLFAHTMAGGVPRAKIMMPVMNWVFKGTGDRHLSSETFWKSDMGKFTDMSFEDVTANTFDHLLTLSKHLREKIEKDGGTVRYVAYGYHGTEVLIKGEYRWQAYSPYLQAWAKIKLENFSKEATKAGLKTTVYNAPEILTNSTGIFVGVEVPLYPFLTALKKEAGSVPKVKEALAKCQSLLKDGVTFEEIQAFTDKTLTSEAIQETSVWEIWPTHNTKSQMETLIGAAGHLVDLHKDPKDLITFVLSEEIFRSTGYIMFHDSFKPQAPVLWLGHDVLAKALATGKTL